ncbi:MAG TPA: class I SAM-dependent methyltransferase [Candidatus Binatia bacterium]|nr:class I SAM-dependent methyltransferase [Candidatus Binatia bacterium]
MFHDISAAMQQAMKSLEQQNERDQPGLRSVDTDVAKLLTMLAITAPQGAWLELGTSAGYSTLWLSLAAKARGVTITTVELDEKKVAMAGENFSRAGADSIKSVHGDGLEYAARGEKLAFCFSDLQPPELNGEVYEKIVPRLVPGGWLVVDNVTSPRMQTELIKRAQSDPRVDAVLLPFPKGDLICRKI